MSRDEEPGAPTAVTPDAAFASLANETRIDILRTLARADESMSFSEIRADLGLRQGGQLNYHLDKLVGHFVVKEEDGYVLSHSGRRVVEAVLSGAVTENPTLGRTEIDWPCERCGASVEVTYEQERVERYCTDCAGTYGQPTRPDQTTDHGYLGSLSLPPAGIEGRSALEIQKAAALWGHLEFLTAISGACPSCSARVEYSLDVCEAHDSTDGLCGECGNRYAVWLALHCTNCIYTLRSSVGGLLVVSSELLEFLAGHSINPFSLSPRYPGVVWDAREDVRSIEPFEARYTYEVDDESISITVDDSLTVVDATKHG